MDFIKFKNICTAKDIINKVKMQPREWEKVFAKHLSGKVLIPKIYFKKLLKFNTKLPISKMSKDLSKHFSKEDVINGQIST